MTNQVPEQTSSQPELETQHIRQGIENFMPAALEDEQVIAKTKLNDVRTELETAQVDLKMSKRAEEDTIAAVTAVEAEVEQMEIKTKNARQAFQHAEEDHKLLKSESKDARLYWKRLKETYAAAQAVAEKSMPLLLRGLVEEEDFKMEDHVKATLELIPAISEDPALLAAAPIALSLDGKQRQAYDTLTCDTVQQVVAEQLPQLEAQVAKEKQKERILRAELLGLWAVSDCAREDKRTNMDELFEARNKRQRLSEDHFIIEKRVKQLETKIPKLVEEHAQWESRNANLEEARRAVKRTM